GRPSWADSTCPPTSSPGREHNKNSSAWGVLSAESCIRKAVVARGLSPGLVGLADTTAEDEAATGTASAFCRLNRWVRGAAWEGRRRTEKWHKGPEPPRASPGRRRARRGARVQASSEVRVGVASG